MSTLEMTPAIKDTMVRRANLRMAWRYRWEYTAADRARLAAACQAEWGEAWMREVEGVR